MVSSLERCRLARKADDKVTVLAGDEHRELIEGLSIGIGAVIKPGLGMLIAAAIVIDNIAESLSIGELVRSGNDDRSGTWRILSWTSLIGVSLISSALLGWFFLRGIPQPILGFLFGAGGGGMLYLTISNLLPDAEERHYQQSAALSMGSGFAVTMAVYNTFELPVASCLPIAYLSALT